MEAVNNFERITYYQESHTVEDYLDKVHILISEAYYTNPHTIVVKFYYGLQISIQNQIITLPVRKPKDANYYAWYNTIYRID